MTKQLSITIFTAFSFFLTIQLSAQPSEALSSPYLDSCFLSFMESNHIPGASACIIKEGQIRWIGAYGDANIELGIPVDTSTLFFLASISKTVAVTPLLQLWEEGLFDLEDSINAYLPFEVKNPNYPSVPITFKMLCTHTSSIQDNWDNMPYYWDGDPPTTLGGYLFDYLNPDGDLYNANLHYYDETPGSNRHYSNISVGLIAYLVEVIGDSSFLYQCQENLFAPLQMNETGWLLSEGLDTMHIAMPYQWIGTAYSPYGHYGFSDYPAGSLRTSIDQLGYFLLCYMNEGTYQGQQVLESSTVDMILSPQIPNIDPSQGLIWSSAEAVGTTWWGHNGGMAGVRTIMYFAPEYDYGHIILSNGESDVGPLGFILYDYASDSIHPHCLPDGITFATQEEVDNFQANHPWCTEIEGDVIIEGEDITNLDGLVGLNSVSGFL